MEKLNVKLSEDLAYWIGVAQSDGAITRYIAGKEKREEITFGVCEKSLPMLEKFKDLSLSLFNRRSGIWKTKGKNEWRLHIGVKRLNNIFKELDITVSPLFIPPKWAIKNSKYFGAYLAGLVDGDGDIRIKRLKGSPQCIIRISTGVRQDTLENLIERNLKFGVCQNERFRSRRFVKSFGRFIKESKWIEIEFCITSKNYKFISDFIIPHINLIYKKQKIINYINMRWAGFEPTLRTAC